jgi:hypothetical protein
MRNLRRAQYLLLLAALVAGQQRVASAGSVSATWTGPANDSGISGANPSINSTVSPPLPVLDFTGTTGPGEYLWEGGTNKITLTFNLAGGGPVNIPVTPTGGAGDYFLSNLFNPSTPVAIDGTVTSIALTETSPCGGTCTPDDIFNLTGGDSSQVFNFSSANIPEPAGIALMASGLMGLAMVRRRRKLA